jgi:hypothetical protein
MRSKPEKFYNKPNEVIRDIDKKKINVYSYISVNQIMEEI